MNSLKFGEIVMSMDTLMLSTKTDVKPLTLALNKFHNISLISIYSSILSSEELDVINVHELTDKQDRKLRKTIMQLNNFKKKRRKQGQSRISQSESISYSSFAHATKPTQKGVKIADLGSDLDTLLS